MESLKNKWGDCLSILIVALTILFSAANVKALDPFTGFTVGAAIFKLDDMLDDAVSQLGQEGRSTSIVAVGELRILLNELKMHGNTFLEKAFDDLDDTQKGLFTNLHLTISTLSEDVDGKLSEANLIVNKITNSVDRSVLGNYEPAVFSYTPQFVSSGNGEDIQLQILGKNLEIGNPVVNLDSVTYQAVSKINNEIVFSIPRQALSFDGKDMVSNTLNLILFKERKMWYCFWLCSVKSEVEYKVAINTLPNMLGQIDVSSELRINKNRQRTRNGPTWSLTASAGAGTKCESHAHSAATGWNITSAYWHQTRNDKQSSSTTNPNWDGGSVSVQLCMRRKTTKSRTMAGHFIITENQNYTSTEETTIVEGKNIPWEGSEVFDLSKDTHRVNITFTSFSGVTSEFSGTDVGNPFVKISYDAVKKQITITPKRPKHLIL